MQFFRHLITHYHSVGIFQKSETGEMSQSPPIGWCLQYDYGSIGHLFVHEDHRRKGLAKVLIQHMCIQIAKDEQIPTSVVEKENTVSVSLFMSLGFVETDSWLALTCSYFSVSEC